MDAIKNRRSVRSFNNQKIDYKTLKELCICGEAAPSARNQGGREYIIVDDAHLLSQLSSGPGHADFVKEAAAVIVVIGKNPIALSTPHMQVQDLACATENILVTATSLGIGSCYIGVYPIEERIKFYTELLQIENGAFPFCLIALGYPKDKGAFYDKNKWNDDLLHHNRY